MKRVSSYLALIILLGACSQNENNKQVSKSIDIIKEDKDSLLVEAIMKKQNFILANAKIDSILPLKSLNQKGYYYFQKGFSHLMLEHYDKAISNFEQAAVLDYKVESLRTMIETTKKMKETYEKYNKK